MKNYSLYNNLTIDERINFKSSGVLNTPHKLLYFTRAQGLANRRVRWYINKLPNQQYAVAKSIQRNYDQEFKRACLYFKQFLDESAKPAVK